MAISASLTARRLIWVCEREPRAHSPPPRRHPRPPLHLRLARRLGGVEAARLDLAVRRVGRDDVPARRHLVLDQAQGAGLGPLAEQAFAGAEEEREGHQGQLVEEAGGQALG